MIDWAKVTDEEIKKIDKIVNRACDRYPGVFYWSGLHMDLCAVIANGEALDLDKLLAFDNPDFAHDIFGIERHLNRKTGKLEDCFLPRCSK